MRRIIKTTREIFYFCLFDCINLYDTLPGKEQIKLLNNRGERTVEKEAYTWVYVENTFWWERETKAVGEKKTILTFKI